MKIALVAQHSTPVPAADGAAAASDDARLVEMSRSLAGEGHQVTVYARRNGATLPAGLGVLYWATRAIFMSGMPLLVNGEPSSASCRRRNPQARAEEIVAARARTPRWRGRACVVGTTRSRYIRNAGEINPDSGNSQADGAQYVMPGNCSRASSSWLARSRGQPKARAAWPLRSAAAAPLVKWTYSPQFIRRV